VHGDQIKALAQQLYRPQCVAVFAIRECTIGKTVGTFDKLKDRELSRNIYDCVQSKTVSFMATIEFNRIAHGVYLNGLDDLKRDRS
jgi:hypothetical protein